MTTSSGRLSLDQVRKVLRRPQYAHAVQAHVLLARVVVDEADRRIAERRALEHLADDQLAGVAGAYDERLLPAGDEPERAAWTLHERAGEQTHTGDEAEQDEPVDRDERRAAAATRAPGSRSR